MIQLKRQITDSISENLTDSDLESSFHLTISVEIIIRVLIIGEIILMINFEISY